MLKEIFILLYKHIFAHKNTGHIDPSVLTRHNSREAYNELWSNPKLIESYLEPARIDGYRFLIQYILKQRHGKKILEVGFGSADFLKLLVDSDKSYGFEIYGLDYAQSSITRGRDLIPSGNFSLGDVYDLPYQDDFFDQVYCLQTLEHLRFPEKAVREMDRVCKADGMILITVPNGDLDNFEGHVHFWNEPDFKSFLGPRRIIDFDKFNSDRAFMISLKPLKVTS